MTDPFPFDVFLSHSAKDKAVVRALAERLRADGLRVWLDEWEIHPGDSIPAKIEEGLEQSRVLVLCMSAHAFGSDWATLEAGTFRFRDPLNKDRRFIPLRLDDAPIKGSLAQFLYINWLPVTREQEYPRLLEACRPPAKPPLLVAGRHELSRNLVEEIARMPRQFHGRLFEVNAILPADRSDLTEITRRALGLPAKFRGRSVVEAFVDLDGKHVFKRIPNGDYQTNILLSDGVLPSVGSKLFKGMQWEPFRYKDISDEDVIGRFSLRLVAQFIGYIKVHRSSSAKTPGLFFDLLRVA